MATAWNEFELVESPETSADEVEWGDFEVAPPEFKPSDIKLTPYQKADVESMRLGGGKAETGMESGTEFLQSIAEIPGQVKEKLFPTEQPVIPDVEIPETLSAVSPWNIRNIVGRLSGGKISPEAIERRVNTLKALAGAALQPVVPFASQVIGVDPTAPTVELISPDPERGSQFMAAILRGEGLTAEDVGKATQIAAGAQPAVANAVNFFTSPLGVAMMGAGGMPRALHAAISATFALEMASAAPHIAQALGDELGKPEDQRDMEKIANLIAEGAITTGFTALAGRGAVKHALPDYSLLRGGAPIERARGLPEEISLQATRPEFAQRFAPGGVPEPGFEGMVKAAPGVPIPEPQDVAVARESAFAKTPEGMAEAARVKAVRQYEERLRGLAKPPRPTIPETVEPPVVETGALPEPPKEFVAFEDWVADFRKRGRPDMTIKEVQALYPDTFPGGSNREGARALRNAAFPEAEKPSPPPPTKPPTTAAEEEMVTLYHGEGGPKGAGIGGSHFSERHDYAAQFGPTQTSVQVPKSVYDKLKAEAAARGTPNDLILPDEWVKKAKPVEKPIEPPVFEVELPPDPVEGKSADWLRQAYADPTVKLSNTFSTKAGMGVKGLSDIKDLVSLHREMKEKASSLLDQARKSPDKAATLGLEAAMTAFKAQLVREAIEVATNTGGWIEGSSFSTFGPRPLDWSKNPEVAKWLSENAKDIGIVLPENFSSGPPPVPEVGVGSSFSDLSLPDRSGNVGGRWRVVEADELVTSDKPGFDPRLQNRMRTGLASREQVLDIATNIDPRALMDAPTSDLGAPKIDAKMQVLSGNARTMALRTLYSGRVSGADQYRQALIDNANRFGIDPEVVRGMKNPVLVQEITDFGKITPEQFADLSNRPTVSSMSPAEQALMHARLLEDNPDVLGRLKITESGDIATDPDFYSAFVNLVGERGRFMTAEGFNKAAIDAAIRNALIGIIAGTDNPILIRSLIEQADSYGLKRVVGGLLKSSGDLLRLRDTPYSLGAIMPDVLRALMEFKRNPNLYKTIDSYIDQNRNLLFGGGLSDEAAVMLKWIAGQRTVTGVSDSISKYTRQAEPAWTDAQAGGGLFGKPPSRKQLIDDNFGPQKPAPAQPELPSQPTPAPKPAEPPKPAGPTGPSPQAPPKGPVIPPSGHFGDDKVSDALDKLKKKKKPQAPPTQQPTPPEVQEGTELMATTEQGIKPPPIPGPPTPPPIPGQEPVRYPGVTVDEDPLFAQSTLNELTTVGGSLLESGYIAFKDWHKAMRDMVGEEYQHYFRRAYNQLRDVPSLYDAARMMTPREEVELFNDAGEKVGKGANKRPGLRVVDEPLIPRVREYVIPDKWIGPDGDTLDWTQSLAANLAIASRVAGKPGMMIADGPGVGKSGTGAAIAHMLTFPVPESLNVHMGKIWDASSPGARARWLLSSYTEGELPKNAPWLELSEREYSALELERMSALKWDMLRDEQKNKVYRNYGFTDQMIREDNVHAGSKDRRKVLIVGTSKAHIETAFIPDFERFGIPQDNITFITYTLLSNPGKPGTPERAKFDAIMNENWAAVIFDEAHALKNAGSGREHSSKKLKADYKVFMTATPMDNVPNAIYFMSEITGKTKFQIADQLGLQRMVRTIGGEDREFWVQKPGISSEDVKAAIVRLRQQAIRDGSMIRREYPWWGDVIGRERQVSLEADMMQRWADASDLDKANWFYGPEVWDKLPAEEKARLLFPSYVEGQMPKQDLLQATTREFTPEELARAEKLRWNSLSPEQHAKIARNSIGNAEWNDFADVTKDIIKAKLYTPEEVKLGYTVKKGVKGPYWMENLDATAAAEQQQIYSKWQAAIDASRNPTVRKNLAGQRSQELKRWIETYKARKVMPLIIKELEAGRNVVVFGNTVNNYRVKGLGDSVWAKVKGSPNDDWPEFPGGLGIVAAELKGMNVPFSQIFGPVKTIKSEGIREFYGNRRRVALVTPQSGGAGLNLDDVIGRHPRTLIIMDIAWPGDMFEQVMYRVSRRNTASESKANILMVRNSIADADIQRTMNRKLAVLRGIQAGQDTDLMGFLDSLNNPEEARKSTDNTRMGDKPVGEFPSLQWEEIKGKTGKLRWKATATPDFMKWWFANGEEKNPLGLRMKREGYWGERSVWSDNKPEFDLKPDDSTEGGAPDIQESALGGYKNHPRYSGTPYDQLLDDINATRTLIENGVDVMRNQDRLDQMQAELDRRAELDERTDNILLDNQEYQDLMQKMALDPENPFFPEWETRAKEITAEVASYVEDRPPEPQATAAAPGIVPTTVVPKSMVGPTKGMHEIMINLKKGINVPIRFKSWLGGGFWNPVAKYIRVKYSTDYGAYLHEAGHALDSMYEFWKNPALEAELMHLGDPNRPGSRSSMRPGKSKKYQLAEGVAEFVRYWAFDPTEATKLGPNMEQAWNAIIDANEKDLGFMREVRNDIQRFQGSPLQEQLSSMIVRGDPSRRSIGTANLIESLIDELHFLRLASDDAFKATKGALKPSKNPYILYRLLRGNFGRADAWLRYGTIDALTGDVTLGGSLNDALQPIRGRTKEFSDYLVAKGSAELIRQGKEPGPTPAMIREVLNKYDAEPDFVEAFNRVQTWQEKLLRYAVDSGYLTEEQYKRMKKENVIYVPMRRFHEAGVLEEQVIGKVGAGRQLAKVGTPASLKRRRGGAQPILDPLGSMVENAYYITFAAEKNRALRALASLEPLPGMGKWLGPTTIPKERIQFQFGKIRSQLEQRGVNVSGLSDETLMFFFREMKGDILPDNTIRVRIDGKNHYYQLNPDLYRSVMAMDKFTLDGIMRIIAAPAQLLRAGVTLEPSFALWRNVLRDTVSAAIISRYTILPFEASIRGMFAMLAPGLLERLGFKNYADLLRSNVAEWQASGAKHAIETAYFDRERMRKFVKEEMTKDLNYAQRGLFWAKSPLMALRYLTQLGEQSTRIGEYQKVFNKLIRQGWNRLDAHLQAGFEARDLQDFAMQGSAPAIKTAKLLTAFWNAGVQGRYRFFRSLYDPTKPGIWKSTLMKGFGFITMAKMLEQYMNWDDEDYWNQPRWQRMLAFHIPIRHDKKGHTKFLLIPVPFEAGLIFASLPGAIMEYMKQKNMDSAYVFGKMFAGQLVDNPIPQPITAALELIPELGYDYFQQRPILPRGMETEPYWARWNDTTSLTAKKAGEILDVSPAKIEHLMRRTVGGGGTQVIHQGVDRILGLATGEKGAPIPSNPLKSIITAPAGLRSQIIDDFYTKLSVLKRESAAREKYGRKDPTISLHDLDGMLEAERILGQLRKQSRGTYDQDKRQRIALRMQNIARKFVRNREGQYRNYTVNRKKTGPENTVDKPPVNE